ncbi:MAG: ATP synthase F1 subunit gamma [Cytophagales bacterium]|uniref:ATP synthase F1 subunit gamma n=1 Tax=Cyclobacterium marinum TaxID=104 RepID=UPI0030DB3415|nr:ATP synthase F1 subunit gamma [Cytophagales bacterium]|tara:strand:+ start:70466 stop:71335 length:870 start_codon:yes stop_codon:yes gene_type:complete
MANLKEVKERINSVSSTQQITKAMKMVAAAKLRRAQEKIVQMRPYSQKLTSILNNISSGAEGVSDIVYAQERSAANLLIVPITSDKGLCGAFNSNIIKAANVVIQEHQGQNITVMPVGKKALDFFKKQDYSLVTAHSGLFENITFEPVKKAAEYVMEAFVEGEFDQVILVYNQFKNVATQVVVKEQFLPIAKMEEEENDISQQDYIFEPSKDYIIEELVPNSLKIQFYKAILDSNASEHGARMTAMSKATDNAADLLKDLKLVYNRTRQAAITNEILEIVAGANALEGK